MSYVLQITAWTFCKPSFFHPIKWTTIKKNISCVCYLTNYPETASWYLSENEWWSIPSLLVHPSLPPLSLSASCTRPISTRLLAPSRPEPHKGLHSGGEPGVRSGVEEQPPGRHVNRGHKTVIGGPRAETDTKCPCWRCFSGFTTLPIGSLCLWWTRTI